MKFQDSSFKGLKVTVSTKSVTQAPTHPPRTHAPKGICPINFFKVGGITKCFNREGIENGINAHNPSWTKLQEQEFSAYYWYLTGINCDDNTPTCKVKSLIEKYAYYHWSTPNQNMGPCQAF